MPDLNFSLGGDISAFERAMNSAVTLGAKKADQLVTLFGQAATRIDSQFGTSLQSAIGLDKVLSGLRVAGAVFVGFEALKEAIDLTNEAAAAAAKQLQHLVDIGNKARDAGVGTGFFQGFIGQAKQLGLEVSQVEAILTQSRSAFQTNIGEGKDAASSTVTDRVKQNVMAGNLSESQASSLASADSLEQKYRAALDILDQLQAKGALLAEYDLAGKMFGSDFEMKLRSGVDIIGSMRQALDGVSATAEGRVATEQEIAEAQRIQSEYADQNRRIVEAWAPVQALIAQYQQEQLQATADLREIYVDVVTAAGNLVSWLAKASSYLSSMGNAPFFARMTQLMNEYGLITDPDIKRQLDQGHADPDPNAAPPLTIHRKRDTSRSLPSLTPAAAPSAKSAPTDQVETYIKSLTKEAAAEKAEAETLGLGNKAKQEAVDLAKAMAAAQERGTPLTEAERQKVIGLADAYAAAKKQIDEYNQHQQQASEQAKFFGDTFESAIDSMVVKGATLQSVMLSVVQALESAALKAAILGEGPLAGLFGTAPAVGATGSAAVGGLFGMLLKLADGGPIVGPGGPRSDQVPVLASHGEYIINAASTRAYRPLLDAINGGSLRHFADGGLISSAAAPVQVATSAGGGVSYTHAPTYQITPANGVTPDQLTAALATYDRQSRRNVLGVIDQAKRRRLG